MTFTNHNSRLGKTFPPEPIAPEKIRQLLDECSFKRNGAKTFSATSMRDKALISVMWRSGLRVGEALALEPRDLDMRRRRITIRHAKGDEFGMTGMDLLTKGILQDWTKARSALNPKRGSPLFCTIKGGKHLALHQNNVRAMLVNRADRAGIDQRFTPHCLRHALARELELEGRTLFQISKALRHKNAATTQIYLSWLSNTLGVEAIQDREVIELIEDFTGDWGEYEAMTA